MHVLLSERCNKMKETNIRKYAELMKELGLTGLEITEENSKVRLERSLAAPAEETYILFQVLLPICRQQLGQRIISA